VDPWHWLSKFDNSTADPNGMPSVWIPGGSHCSQMGESSPTENVYLAEARVRIAAVLASWMAQ